MGWVPLEAFVTDQLKEEQKEEMKRAHGDSGLDSYLVFETDARKIEHTIASRHPENRGQRYFDSYTPLYILGSSLEKGIAARRGANQLSISYPVYNRVIMDRGYAGYRGGLHLF
jgi:nitrogenase molybdenum-iron protein beta chain